MVFRETPPPGGALATPSALSGLLCTGHCACSGYGTRANCPPLIILATVLSEDPVAAALFSPTQCPARSPQA